MNYTPISSVVADANLAVRAVFPIGTGKELEQLRHWKLNRIQIYAPDLWYAEVTSAIRIMLFRKTILPDEGQAAIYNLFALGIQVVASDVPLCTIALKWAERLGQSKVYDSLYLALAERTGSEFWTADERLVNRSRQVGANWVHWVGDI